MKFRTLLIKIFVSSYAYIGNDILGNPEEPIKKDFLADYRNVWRNCVQMVVQIVFQAILCVRNVDARHINVKFVKALAESCIIH